MTKVATPIEDATLRIVMNRSFSKFLDKERSEFLNGLSVVSGCPAEEMRQVRFRRGCVVAEINMSEEAVRIFLDGFEHCKGDAKPPKELLELAEFLKREKVENANATFRVRLAIKDGASHRQELVFVHGWRGDSGSFGKLPDYLSQHFDCPAKVYEYPTGSWTHSPAIYYVAQNLNHWLKVNVAAEKVALVTHSMGGLVARKCLVIQQYSRSSFDGRVKHVALIASPNNASSGAAILRQLPSMNSPQLTDLAPSSAFVPELNAQWLMWTSARVPHACTVRSIYGTADAIVSPANAQGLDAEAVPILGATHLNIVDQTVPGSELEKTLVHFLTEAGFTRQ